MDFDITKLRNLGVIAHIDAGKTTTTDHLLYYSGAKHRLGRVDEGTTETDYDAEEQERGITIYSACVPFHWRDCRVNLIDTPGHVDFTAEVERSLRVLDGAIVVFDAQKGVEAQSETVWRQADKYRIPRLVLINKMDVVGADFEAAVAEIRERLQGNPVPLTIPIGSGSPKDSATPFVGVVDVLAEQAIYFEKSDDGKTFRTEAVPESMQAPLQRWREHLFDVVTQFDDEDLITSAYLEGKEIPVDSLRLLLRRATLAHKIQPVFAGSGREHIGIQPLLDGVVYYLPSPVDVPPVEGINPEKKGKKEIRKPDPNEPFCGLVFKIVASRHGDLYFVRIYSGKLAANSRVWNPVRRCKEFASKLYHIHADPRVRDDVVPVAYAGDIVGVIGPKDSITGDTLCDQHHPIVLEQIRFADAVVSQSIEPESSADRAKLEEALTRLAKEDPTFTWKIDPETGQMIMSGMGTLHLEVKRHLMEKEYRLRVRVGKPRVSYRETLLDAVTVTGECHRHAAGANLFAETTVRFEPAPDVATIEIVNAVDNEAIPHAFVVAAEEGIRGALQSGELGYPVIHVRATILDLKLDPEMSNEVAFQAAGADAVHKAMRDNLQLLEPVMRLEVTTPEEHLGAVIADLNARRADITETIPRGKLQQVEALVPLANMFDYTDKIRSLTQGRASWSMEPHSYRPVPPDVLKKMLGDELGL